MKITTFEVSLNTGIPPEKKEQEVKKYVPPMPKKKKGRKYQGKDRDLYSPTIEKMLERNEYLAYEEEAKEDKVLKYELIQKHDNYALRRRFQTYKESIGNLRTKYNQQRLYSAQGPVYLISLRYNDVGRITKNGNECYSYLSFQEAYQRCVQLKIADPRFVPPELIEKLRDRINSEDTNWKDWTVPTEIWIKSFEKKIQTEAYNSVFFPLGWTREDTAVDSDL